MSKKGVRLTIKHEYSFTVALLFLFGSPPFTLNNQLGIRFSPGRLIAAPFGDSMPLEELVNKAAGGSGLFLSFLLVHMIFRVFSQVKSEKRIILKIIKSIMWYKYFQKKSWAVRMYNGLNVNFAHDSFGITKLRYNAPFKDFLFRLGRGEAGVRSSNIFISIGFFMAYSAVTAVELTPEQLAEQQRLTTGKSTY